MGYRASLILWVQKSLGTADALANSAEGGDIKIPRFGYTPCCVAALPLRPLNCMTTSSSVNRNMMKRLASFLMVTAAATMLCTVGVMTGCEKDVKKPEQKQEQKENPSPTPKPDPNPAPKPKKEPKVTVDQGGMHVDATNYDMWVYVSMENGGKLVGYGDATKDEEDAAWKARSDWDIAFHRFEVRLNGGDSGNGKGEAADLGVVDFDGVKAIPADAKFEKDMKDYPIIIDFSAMQTGGKFQKNASVSPILTSYTQKKKDATGKDYLDYHGPMKKLAQMGKYELSNKVFIMRTASGKGAFKLLWTKYSEVREIDGQKKEINALHTIRFEELK